MLPPTGVCHRCDAHSHIRNSQFLDREGGTGTGMSGATESERYHRRGTLRSGLPTLRARGDPSAGGIYSSRFRSPTGRSNGTRQRYVCRKSWLEWHRYTRPKLMPINALEPIRLNAAREIRTFMTREHLSSAIVVTSAFRSERSSRIDEAVLPPVGIRVSCAPAFTGASLQDWSRTWHGVQEVTEQVVKLQYYRFLRAVENRLLSLA